MRELAELVDQAPNTLLAYRVVRLLLGSLIRADVVPLLKSILSNSTPVAFVDYICEQEPTISPFVIFECMETLASHFAKIPSGDSSLHQYIVHLCLDFVTAADGQVFSHLVL